MNAVGIDGRITTVSWLCFVGFWLIASRNTKPTIGRTTGGRGTVFRALMLVAVAALATSGTLGSHGPHTPGWFDEVMGAVGAALCACGVAIAIWARVHLGRNWGMPGSIKEEPELITSGPYHWVRHPIYSGVVVAMAGSALVHGMFWWLLAVAFFGYFLYNATAEEREMAQRFPDQYPRYRAQTKKLIPYIV